MRKKRKRDAPAPPEGAIRLMEAADVYDINHNTLRCWLLRNNYTLYYDKNKYYVLPEWIETYCQEKEQKKHTTVRPVPPGKIRLTEAARRLSTSRQSLHDHYKRGNITLERIGTGWYVDFEVLLQELQEHRTRGRRKYCQYLITVFSTKESVSYTLIETTHERAACKIYTLYYSDCTDPLMFSVKELFFDVTPNTVSSELFYAAAFLERRTYELYQRI